MLTLRSLLTPAYSDYSNTPQNLLEVLTNAQEQLPIAKFLWFLLIFEVKASHEAYFQRLVFAHLVL